MAELRLSPEEQLTVVPYFERLNGFVEGARALAEHMKKLKVDEIIAARKKPTDGAA